MCKKIPNLEGYNATDGIEDPTFTEDPEGYDAFLDHVDNHFTDEEDYNRELDVPVWVRV
jgi:hypothetical protein